jgi:hypothetical protein
VDELNKIKKNVKNELKRYDQTFVSKFFRQPAKTDKEPLRPLYMYYKKLKQLIDKKVKSGATGSQVNHEHQSSGVRSGSQASAGSTRTQGSNNSSIIYSTSRDSSLNGQVQFNINNGVTPTANSQPLIVEKQQYSQQ